jgi:hypothetical protein
MNFKRNIKIFLIYIISIFIFQLDVYASSSFDWYELQITPTSSEIKIEKLQKLFNDLWLYNWEIDWKYVSIEWNLINYQINKWLITNNNDWWAWYFWEKTMILLEEDYGDMFHELAKKYLKKDIPELWKRTFIVTAYYSPLPNQNVYSYDVYKKRNRTYEEEVKLQWEWKITASWLWVFSWLIAAPDNYSFWTKIKLDWIWVWNVQDRWWAIVNSWERWHEYDRIDVWMWYWEEWLQRAIKLWKREVNWEIVWDETLVSIEFDESPVSKYNDLTLDAENPIKEDVEKLQNLFTDVWLYDWEVDWNFENIKDILIEFQIENWIIESSISHEAWYFWKKTIAVLRERYWWEIFKKIEYNVAISLEKKQELTKIRDLLLDFINKKSNWNIKKAEKYKLNLKTSLDMYVIKVNDKIKKQQLLYLNSIL